MYYYSLSTYIINLTVSFVKTSFFHITKIRKKNGQIHTLYTTSTTPTQGSNEFPCLRYIDRNTFKFLVFYALSPNIKVYCCTMDISRAQNKISKKL